MGAETSSLEECSLEYPIITGSETQWEVRHGITFENDTPITVFSERSKKKDNFRVFERNIKVIEIAVIVFKLILGCSKLCKM